MFIVMARTLIEAVQKSDVALAKKILGSTKYACIDCQTARQDGTALFWASCRGLIEIVQMLLALNADVNTTTAWGSTPLHAAADSNNCQILKLLLKSGANVNTRTHAGDTPCHLAAYRGHAHAVQLLVEDGANIGITNNRCHLPVHEAELGCHVEIANYLQAVSLLGTEQNQCSNLEFSRNCRVNPVDQNYLTLDLCDGQDTTVNGCDTRVNVPGSLRDNFDTASVDSDRLYDSFSSPSNSSSGWASGFSFSDDFLQGNDLSLTSHSLSSSSQLTFTNIPV